MAAGTVLVVPLGGSLAARDVLLDIDGPFGIYTAR
jgi:hypothetical protein